MSDTPQPGWLVEAIKKGLLEVQEYVKLCIATARGAFTLRDTGAAVEFMNLYVRAL